MKHQWFETAKEAAQFALYMSVCWAHEDGRCLNVPFEETPRASFAEADLLGDKFFPALVLMLVPGKVDGVEIRSLLIPERGTRQRIIAAAAVPAAIQNFRKEAIGAGAVAA